MRVPKSMILCALAVSGLLLVLFTTCPAQESHLVATEANPRFADTQSNEGERSKLPPNALQMARIIGVESDIEKLSSLAAKGAGAAPGLCLEELSLRQQITDAVIAASLDVDSVAAEIDYEREQTVELRSRRALDSALSVVSCSSARPPQARATRSASPQAGFLPCSRSAASGRYMAGSGRHGFFLTCWRPFSASRRSGTATTLTTSGPI